ncbi:hypothetical protein K501DRAFT_280027 [Backusella circina FSU 941]|nr:hypothetical protein K501DRAFT_280027 [Backusella circina FSU 941]
MSQRVFIRMMLNTSDLVLTLAITLVRTQAYVNNSKKKLAVYCLNPCTVKKYQGITNFLLKSQEDLKIKSLCLPTTLFQWHMLNAWSNNLENDNQWKELCQVPFDTAAFGQLPDSNVADEFKSPFTIADQPFTKKALFVHMTAELYDFSLEDGFQLKDFVSHALEGWKKATENWSLVWILDENELFGKKVESLDEYRQKLHFGIQLYASDIPIYTLTVNYDGKSTGDLSHQLAWIQHRHHFCLGESFLLKWAETPLLPSSYFNALRCIYLNSEAKVDGLKWKDNFVSMLQHRAKNGDTLDYIRPSTLGLPIDISHFVTPLLSNEKEEKEMALRSGTHQVVFNCILIINIESFPFRSLKQ